MSNRCSPTTPLTSRGCTPWVPPHQRSLPENMRSMKTSCERDATSWIPDPSSLGASLQNKHKRQSWDFTCFLFLSLGAMFCSQLEIMCEFQMILMDYDLLKAFLSSFCFWFLFKKNNQCIFLSFKGRTKKAIYKHEDNKSNDIAERRINWAWT